MYCVITSYSIHYTKLYDDAYLALVSGVIPAAWISEAWPKIGVFLADIVSSLLIVHTLKTSRDCHARVGDIPIGAQDTNSVWGLQA